MKNYYEILEVSEKASKEVIENSYKALKNKYQPQNFEGDARSLVEERLKNINEAYSVISDEFLRNQYDMETQKDKGEEFANNIKTNKKPTKKIKPSDENIKKEKNISRKSKIGTAGALGEVVKAIFSNVKEINVEKEKPNKKAILSLLGAIGIVVLVGILLWFIPATNGFIKSFLLIG